MNKGIKAATGNIIGILNSDDIYTDEFVIEHIVKAMAENNVDSCYGDLVYVAKNDTEKIIRYWKSDGFYKERFRKGWMPPHPTFFVRREVYEKYGLFNLDFPLAADYELILRFLYKQEISTAYIPEVLVKMRAGGTMKQLHGSGSNI
jgi:GT2 family glycosyltransferase